MGDFTGFTFGGQHSDGLDIIRVSSGDRYEEQLHPEIKDRTAEVLGVHGDYYFGSDYGTRTFDIDFAFDHLTERQFRELRKIFGTKNIKELIFDERPYKKYMAKIESPVELSYVCFDEPKRNKDTQRDGVRRINRNGTVVKSATIAKVSVDAETFRSIFPDDGDYVFEYRDSMWYYDDAELIPSNYGIDVVLPQQVVGMPAFTISNLAYEGELEKVIPYKYDYSQTERIYKGEGKISFICHFPFAKSVFKELPEGSEEWAISSGILTATEKEIKHIDEYDNGQIIVYNPGDIETGFRLCCDTAPAEQFGLFYGDETLVIDPFDFKSNGENSFDIGFVIDTNTGLINGIKNISYDGNRIISFVTSGNIYNEYVNSGYFFHLQTNDSLDLESKIIIINGSGNFRIFYDYLYF